jgi:protein HIRA/HIR1
VCIYELRAGSGARAFGSSDQPSVENWKHVTTLRGHMNNVLDVAWSPDDRWLASCSVDNKVLNSSNNLHHQT